MRSWESIRDQSIFPGESKGKYGTLLGWANQPGRQFDHVDLTGMTVDQVIDFANSKGPYAAYSRSVVGRTATPMGAYQIVGSTLKDMRDKGIINGNAIFDKTTQDYLGQAILERQGSRAWEGWKGAHIGPGQFQAPASLAEYRASLGMGVPPQEFIDHTKSKDMPGLPVDTSFAGLFGMDSMPGIDGLHSSQMARDGVPQSNPNSISPEMAMFSGFNEARDMNQATGIGAAFQDALGPSLSDFAVTDPFSEMFSGVTAAAPAQSVASVPSDRFDQAFDVFSGPTAAMPADVSISTITPDTAPQSTITGGVPQGRFDQAFDTFSAPSLAATTAQPGAPLDAPVDISARPEVMGPSFNFDGVTATPSAKPDKDQEKEKNFEVWNNANTRGAVIGAMLGGPKGAILGAVAPTAVRGVQSLASGLFGGGGLGGLGGLGFGGGMGPGTPGYESWASSTPEGMGYASTLAGGSFWDGYYSGGGNLNPESGRDFARGMAAQQAAREAMGLSTWGDAFSEALGGLGGLGGGGSSSGGTGGGKGGSGGKGGGNKGDAGVGGADGGK
jgi:hypothetical protein